MIFRAEMNDGRYWRIEVEHHTRNVLEVFPKADNFAGKLENHVQPRLAEFEATSTELKLFSDSSENIPAMLRTFEARTEIPRRKAESKPVIPLHSSDTGRYCAALIASRFESFRVANSGAGKSFRRVVRRESVSGRVWRQDDDPKLTILTLAPCRPLAATLFG
jgi:hypothetical protein